MTAATTPNPDTQIEPTGALRAWLVHFDLLDLWVRAEDLPTPRADYYRRELLRLYVVQRRREERSTARMLFKDRL